MHSKNVTDDRYYLIGGIEIKGIKLTGTCWVPYFLESNLLKRGIEGGG